MKKTVLLGILVASAVGAYAQLLGPTPYLSASDSPFSSLSFSYFHLENFEDGALNTPGVSVNAGTVIANPGVFTDSVDADDGVIDGSGAAGHSLYSGGALNAFTFTFDASVLGTLPTHAGLVWTDVGNTTTRVMGMAPFTFEAFDSANNLIGSSGPVILGDGSALSATAEDRFFGVISTVGIARITIRTDASTDWEIDHLQYGAIATTSAVPEPSSFAWGFVTIGGICFWRRFRSRKS